MGWKEAPMVDSPTYRDKNIIFFDGVCNYCNFWVQILLSHDKKEILKFSSLQSHFARTFLSHIENQPDSIIYWREGNILYKSKAVLAITSDLGGIWLVFSIFKIVPSFILDKAYDFMAQRRYSWFGQRDTCHTPTVEEKSRFLE